MSISEIITTLTGSQTHSDLVGQPLYVWHDNQRKPGTIVAIVPSPFLGDHDAPVALWHSDVDYALDYLDITDVRAVLS